MLAEKDKCYGGIRDSVPLFRTSKILCSSDTCSDERPSNESLKRGREASK